MYKMKNIRIIKKYPNRRLYDTEDSKYITLEDISVLVTENKEFVVIDSKTESNLTRNIPVSYTHLTLPTIYSV